MGLPVNISASVVATSKPRRAMVGVMAKRHGRPFAGSQLLAQRGVFVLELHILGLELPVFSF